MKRNNQARKRDAFHRVVVHRGKWRDVMGEQMVSSVVTVAVAIVGLAIIATLVSKNADTSNIISSGGSAFSNALSAAEAPVTGQNMNVAGTFSSAGYHMA